MFWFLGIEIAVAVTAWSILLGHHARNKDLLSALAVIGVGFIAIFLSGFLFQFYTYTDLINLIASHGLMIAFAGIAFTSSFWVRMYANNHMPIGIVIMISGAAWILSVFIYELLFLKSLPTMIQGILVCLVFVGVTSLIWVKNDKNIGLKSFSWKGLVSSCVCGLLLGPSFAMIVEVSQETSLPLLSALLWQVFAALFIFFVLGARSIVLQKSFSRFSPKAVYGFMGVALMLSATTVGFAYGGLLGSVTVLAGIESSSIMLTALFSWLFFKEKLVWKQWVAMSLVTICIIAIKFVS